MKVALLWLINEANEVLIARRADHMDSDAGVWGPSVSGEVEPGETGEVAILRETEEELGLRIDGLVPIPLHDETYEHKDGVTREFSVYYARTGANITDQAKLEPDEVAEVRWISVPDLKELFRQHPESIIISDAKQLWQNILANLDVAVARR